MLDVMGCRNWAGPALCLANVLRFAQDPQLYTTVILLFDRFASACYPHRLNYMLLLSLYKGKE